MLGDDLRLALLHDGPIHRRIAYVLDAELGGIPEMVEDLGAVEQGLRRDAADVQARSAELVVLLDQGRFESVLAGADRRRVAGRSTADDGNVVDLVFGPLWQMLAPYWKCEAGVALTASK